MSGHKVSVMFLGRPNAGMSEQLLDRADIRAIGQQFDGESVSESVWVSVDFRQPAEGANHPSKAAHAGLEVTGPGPKEVLRVDGWKHSEGIRRGFVEQHLLSNSGLDDSQGQVPANERGAFQRRNVRDAQPAVEQDVHQCAGAAADVLGFSGVYVPYLVAGSNQRRNFVGCQRRGCEVIRLGESQRLGRVLLNPFVLRDAPSKERAKLANLRAPRSVSNFVDATISLQAVGGYVRNRNVHEFAQRGKRSAVAAKRGRCHFNRPQVLAHGDGQKRGLGPVNGPSALQPVQAPQRLGRIAGLEGLANQGIPSVSVTPNRAGAERVRLPFVLMFTAGQMAAVGGQWHGENSINSYTVSYTAWKEEKNSMKICPPFVRIEQLATVASKQLKQVAFRSNRIKQANLALSYAVYEQISHVSTPVRGAR